MSLCLSLNPATPAHAQASGSLSPAAQILKDTENGNDGTMRSLLEQVTDPLNKNLAVQLGFWIQFQNGRALENRHSKTPPRGPGPGGNEILNYSRMVQFIRKHPDWPGISAMIRAAENHLPDSLPDNSVIAWFDDYKPKTVKGVHRYLQALIHSGRAQKSREFIREYWEKETLSRQEQQTLYTFYKTSLSKKNHIRRLDTALFAGQHSNARALAEILKDGYPELVEARIALSKSTGNVNALINKVPEHLQGDPGLLYERLKWRRKKDLNLRAIEILNTPIEAERVKNKSAWWRERHIIIRRLLEKKQYKSAYLLAKGHIQKEGFSFAQAEWLAGWISLQFLDDPRAAFTHFETLYNGVSSPISQARASYWGGRAAAKLDRSDISTPWYQASAGFQSTFYGQLALKELSLDGTLPATPPPAVSLEEQAAFEQRDLVRAARLLKEAGLKKYSSRFLQAYAQTLETPKEYRYAADIAVELGQLNNAIRIAKNASKKGLFLSTQAYPTIENSLSKVKEVEWALVHGLIRQESAFDFDAKSSAGAMGLMQLLPSTAKEVARKNDISHRKSWLTQRPNHNIRLGSLYLAQMLRRYDGYYPMAIAAYNGGPGRVDKWIKIYGDPRKGEINVIDWIELIPIYETRNYVQRVMEATYIYRLRLQGIEPNIAKGKLHTHI